MAIFRLDAFFEFAETIEALGIWYFNVVYRAIPESNLGLCWRPVICNALSFHNCLFLIRL